MKNEISFYIKLMNSKIFLLIIPIFGLILGLVFILQETHNVPITRDRAETYSGTFEKYESSKNYCDITLSDGSVFDIYPHTQKEKFRDKMTSLERGTPLFLSVNPNNGYVIEIKNQQRNHT